MSQSGVWLVGWIMIAVHFAASLFEREAGFAGNLATWIALSALASAGILFMWASVPYRQRASSRWMLAGVTGSSVLYIGLLAMLKNPGWLLDPAALLFCAVPLAVSLTTIGTLRRPERWVMVTLFSLLAVYLLVVQHRPDGAFLGISGLLVTVFLGCSIHFLITHRHMSTGSLITIAGFFAWASVFVVAPLTSHLLPGAHIDNEVWNLPKYMVAVGMILLLLEDQIAHNRHLALHDELTGLPNRRLFRDRLDTALNRAQRGGTQVALLLIDLNRFKQVNDTAGHHVGDELLKQVSSVVLTRVRISDTVARIGGDEFAVILEGQMQREQAAGVGSALKALLSEPVELHGHTLQIGASVGLAMYPLDGKNAEALCVAADVTMYDEKHAARGNAEFGQSTRGQRMAGPQPG